MVLETVFETADGSVALIDFMPIGQANSSVIRLVQGRRGNVAMRLHLTLRFDYGATVPWVTQLEDKSGLTATAGPSRVVFRAPLPLQGEDLATVAEFNVAQGECVPLVLTHVPSHIRVPWTLDWRAAFAASQHLSELGVATIAVLPVGDRLQDHPLRTEAWVGRPRRCCRWRRHHFWAPRGTPIRHGAGPRRSIRKSMKALTLGA